MTKNEKYAWLQTHAPGPFAMARTKAVNKLDELTPMFCFCGRLATGLHTSYCKRFQDRLKGMVINELKGLLPK